MEKTEKKAIEQSGVREGSPMEGAGSMEPRWESSRRSPRPRVRPPHSPLTPSRDPRAPRSPSELVPSLLDQR